MVSLVHVRLAGCALATPVPVRNSPDTGQPHGVERLKHHGLTETEGSIKAKLRRGTFAATLLLATLAALEKEGLRIADL